MFALTAPAGRDQSARQTEENSPEPVIFLMQRDQAGNGIRAHSRRYLKLQLTERQRCDDGQPDLPSGGHTELPG